MQYIKQSLTKGEKLVFVADFHWMYNVSAIMNIVFGVVMAIAIIAAAMYIEPMLFPLKRTPEYISLSLIDKIRVMHPGVKLLAFFMVLMGILRFAQMMIIKSTTEIAVTSKRLVYKRGLIARHVGEMSVDRIEGVNVLQGVMGRLFDYGRVMVRGMGVGEVVLPPIDKPIKFRKAIEQAREMTERQHRP